MASVTKCNARWTCRVSNANSVLKKTFNTKKEAIAWGAIKDLELEQGKQSSGETSTFAELGWDIPEAVFSIEGRINYQDRNLYHQ